jgi:hypothetical protein
MLTQEQFTKQNDAKIQQLWRDGYYWDKQMSCSAAGVIMRKGGDIYFFGLDGEVLHNPKGFSVKV